MNFEKIGGFYKFHVKLKLQKIIEISQVSQCKQNYYINNSQRLYDNSDQGPIGTEHQIQKNDKFRPNFEICATINWLNSLITLLAKNLTQFIF